MSDFNPNYRDRRGGRRFGGRNSGGRGFGGRDRMMHKAVCANCGKECEVPFRPSGDRPVYCSDCFEKMGNKNGNFRRPDDRNFPRPRFDNRPSSPPPGQMLDQLQNLNAKLDRIITMLEPKFMEKPKSVESAVLESIVAEPIVAKSEVTKPVVKKSKSPKKKSAKEKVAA